MAKQLLICQNKTNWNLYKPVLDFSEIDLPPEQQEVPDALGSAAGRMMQGQLEERESEAPGETEVADWTQWRETRKMGHLTMRQIPSGLWSCVSYTCRHRRCEGKKGKGHRWIRCCLLEAAQTEKPALSR